MGFKENIAVCIFNCVSLCLSYGPPSNTPVFVAPQPSENAGLSFVDTNSVNPPIGVDYGYIKPAPSSYPVEVKEPTKVEYWWQKVDSPFVVNKNIDYRPCSSGQCQQPAPVKPFYQQPVAVEPVKNDITSVKFENNPYINNYVKGTGNCNGYNCVNAKVLCDQTGYICTPKYLCQNNSINKNNLNFVNTENRKICAANKETCCKIIQCENNDCASSSYNQNEIPVFSQSYGGQSVSLPSNGYENQPNIDYTPLSSNTLAPAVAPYTGPQNVTPYPGCAAALKCVPDNYCTLEGVMSNTPVVLTKDLLLSRVPLTECLDPATGIIGKCCRDPNYKDPWPADLPHDHSHDHTHDHTHDHSQSNQNIVTTQVPLNTYTIKKPIGGFEVKPHSFTAGLDSNERVIPIQYPSTPNLPSQPSYQISDAAGSSNVYPNIAPVQPVVDTYLPPQPPVVLTPSSPPPPPPPVSYIPPPAPTSYILPSSPKLLVKPVIIPTYDQQNVISTFSTETPIAVSTLAQETYQSDQRVIQSTKLPVFIQKQSVPTSSLQCGFQNPAQLSIVGWHVSVHSSQNKNLVCGGAIVSDNAILTAAHCLDNADAPSIEIKVPVDSKLYKAATIVRHPQYDAVSYKNDLALVILKEPIAFENGVQHICLPTIQSQQRVYNRQCFVSDFDYYNPEILRETKVQIFPYKDCEIKLKNTYLGKYFVLNENFSCVSTPTDVDLCQVKLGAPIACNRGDGFYELFGVKSWDLGCQEYKKSAIFSNSDITWIQNVLATPVQKLVATEEIYLKEKFRGDTLEGVNIQEKPGFALGYGK